MGFFYAREQQEASLIVDLETYIKCPFTQAESLIILLYRSIVSTSLPSTMAIETSLTYLVWGAARGIGKALISELLQRQGSTVIAAVRQSSSIKELQNLPKAEGARLLIVAIDASDFAGSKSKVASVAKDNSINSLDVVIASAGGGCLYPHCSLSQSSVTLNSAALSSIQ